MRICIAAVSVVVVASSCSVRPDQAQQPFSGKELFGACTNCHGEDGLGNKAIAAPSIAGLPAWYVEAQIRKFRTGVRGAHPDDYEGLRMRPMSRQMMSELEIRDVSAYVASMSTKKAAVTMTDGDAAAGSASYATCTACHGADGKGNEALKAPPLAGQPDWYLVSQLHKFKKGIRGTNPADVTGATMRPMAMTLVDDKQVRDVVAHINTLSH